MNRRRFLATSSSAAVGAALASMPLAQTSAIAKPSARKKGLLMLNRIAPSHSDL